MKRGTRDAVFAAVRTLFGEAPVELIEASPFALLIVDCPNPTEAAMKYAEKIIDDAMPSGVSWACVFLEQKLNTPANRAAIETVWRMGDLAALHPFIAELEGP